MSEKITGSKADVPECILEGCDRIGVLKFNVFDTVSVSTNAYPETALYGTACCKTHLVRYLQKQKVPRYSRKRVQRLAGTLPLKQVPSGVKIMEQQRETPKS